MSGEIFLFYEEISHFCVAINQKRIELLGVEAGFVIFSVILKPFKSAKLRVFSGLSAALSVRIVGVALIIRLCNFGIFIFADLSH